MRRPLIDPTPRNPTALARALQSPSTQFKRAIRAANALLNSEEGLQHPEEAAAYVAVAFRLMREVEILDRKDHTTEHKSWIRQKLIGQRFAGKELEEIAAVLRTEVSPRMRKRVGPGWPSISVVSRERKFVRKQRLKVP